MTPTGIGNYPPGVTDNDPHFADDEDADYDDEDELAEAMYNCHGWFEDNGKGAFMCGAVGSEDCDACPFYSDLGLTAKQCEERDCMEERALTRGVE